MVTVVIAIPFRETTAMDPAFQGILALAFVDGTGEDFLLPGFAAVPGGKPFLKRIGELRRGSQVQHDGRHGQDP
jgi:hypothetical protein